MFFFPETTSFWENSIKQKLWEPYLLLPLTFMEQKLNLDMSRMSADAYGKYL